MSSTHESRPKRVSEAAPVQVFLGRPDRERLDRLTTQPRHVQVRGAAPQPGRSRATAARSGRASSLRLIGLVADNDGHGDDGDVAVHHDRILVAAHEPPTPPKSPPARKHRGKSCLFVDTSAWVPLLLRRHPDHAALTSALRQRVARGERIVATNLVLAETYTLLLYRGHRAAALTFLQAARELPNVVVTSTPDLERRAVTEWLEPYDDQDFSFADAVSFAVMKERRIARALTLDKHFVTAGFEPATRLP